MRFRKSDVIASGFRNGASATELTFERRGDIGRLGCPPQVGRGNLRWGAARSLAVASTGSYGVARAGDRAPDALVRGVVGGFFRLFGLFFGLHWTLL